MRRCLGISLLAAMSWLATAVAQQVPIVQGPSYTAPMYEGVNAGGPYAQSAAMNSMPPTTDTGAAPGSSEQWYHGPYEVASGCGNCNNGCCGQCAGARGHGNRPWFSDTICDDGSMCWPQSFPLYFSLFGGWSDVDNFERKLRDPVFDSITEISGAGLSDDVAGGGAIGWMVHPLARTELEFTYRQNAAEEYHVLDYDNDILISSTSTPATGQIQGYSGMWNFVVHTEPRRLGCASLYGGGGIGALFVDGAFSTATEDFAINDSSFAYQFIAGLNYVVSYRLDTFVEYRYLGADYLQVQNLTSGVSMGDYTYDSHGVFFGLRFGR